MPDLREKLQATLRTRYRIARELTGAGMSRVFLAHDEQLQREVVIKVLSPDLLDEARVERFRQEVLQTARLQHPTIISVLDVGAIEDTAGHHVPFYIMPYARGESLRSRLHHEGRLSISVSMRVLRSVFDALAYAHAHGVVHRDIKPENIFLSGTNALLADFGIAKAIAGPHSHSEVTSPGMAIGTPTYMAPEAIVDAGRIGPRADLYSTGVVAYEMLTGSQPWGKTTPVETLAAQARGGITPLRSVRPDVPAAMAAVIEACVAWDLERRPESAASALQALESVPVHSTPDTPDAIAAGLTIERARLRRRMPATVSAGLAIVGLIGIAILAQSAFRGAPTPAPALKLAVLYPDLPAGIARRAEVAERLYHMFTAALTPVSGLRLAGLVSVPRLTELGLQPAQIRDSLRREGVDSLLALNVTTAANGVTRLVIELHAVSTGSSETVAGPIDFTALDRVSPDSLSVVVRLLAAQSMAKLHLVSANQAVSETQMTGAYMAWLSGRDAMARRTPDGLSAAIAFFERAIALDSAYAQAHADLAQTLALALFYHYRMRESPFELAARALRMADRAVRLRPEFADGYLAHGLLGAMIGAPLSVIQSNYDNAARLLSANPYYQTWYLQLLAKQGRFDEAVQRAEEEVRLDPRSAGQRVASAMYALPARQYITAVRNASEARNVLANVAVVSQIELWGRLLQGGQALDGCASVPAGPYVGARALCLERTGREREGRALIDALFATLTGKAAMDSTFDLALPFGEMALYAAQHGDRDAARQWIRQAFAESAAGIDYRFMRSGMFEPALIAFADSLQASAYRRVSATAAGEAKR